MLPKHLLQPTDWRRVCSERTGDAYRFLRVAESGGCHGERRPIKKRDDRMTKLQSIAIHRFEMPLAQPIADARNVIRSRACVLIEAKTDDGLTGWGEAACFAGCGALVETVIQHYAERLAGRSADDPSALYDEMFKGSLHFGRRGLVVNALSGIDVALWDLKAQRDGLPLADVIGRRRDGVRAYFNGGYFVDDDPLGFVRTSAKKAKLRGVDALKIKIGRSVDDDAMRIEAARSVLGTESDLMVDANGILDLEYLERLDPILQDAGVRWMEEPVALTRMSDLAAAKSVMKTPIAGYELEQTSDAWAELIEAGVVDIAQPDAIWSGGITECVRTFAPAKAADVQWVPHNFATIVCLAANAHLACAAPTGGWLECDSNDNPFLWELDTDGAFSLSDGNVTLPSRPGLGVVPALDRIEKYRVT